MVKGLGLFRQHFADCANQYVLIGGTAATLAMEGAGLDFRATKDLDIVLHIEALTASFGTTRRSPASRRSCSTRTTTSSSCPVAGNPKACHGSERID